MSASRPWSPRLLGVLGALLAGAVYPAGNDPREMGTRTLWSRDSRAVRGENAKCCPL